MENSKNNNFNEKTKNKKHSNNISSEESNKDLTDKKENNLKEITEESVADNQKKSEDEETIWRGKVIEWSHHFKRRKTSFTCRNGKFSQKIWKGKNWIN